MRISFLVSDDGKKTILIGGKKLTSSSTPPLPGGKLPINALSLFTPKPAWLE